MFLIPLRTCVILAMAVLLSISLFVKGGWAAARDTISFLSVTGGDRLIYLMDTRGEMLRKPFVIGPIGLSGLTWAPDGRSFAYHLRRSGNLDIYVMDVGADEHRQLTFDGSRDLSPVWSPDGKWIAFASDRAGSMNLYRMDVDGENLMQLTDQRDYCHSTAWAPDSQWISFVSGSTLFVMDTRGKRLTQVETFVHRGGAWSPDGKRLLFTASVGEWNMELFSIDVNGENRHRLTWLEQPALIYSPMWSPSGKWIAYIFREIRKVQPVIGPENLALPIIYVIDTAGDGLAKPLESTSRLAAYSLGWAPEGFLSVSPSTEKQTTLWSKLKQSENAAK